jgi:hypothetical protein
MDAFYMIRNVPNIQKPSTSEMIDWLQALLVAVSAFKDKTDLLSGCIAKKNGDLESC